MRDVRRILAAVVSLLGVAGLNACGAASASPAPAPTSAPVDSAATAPPPPPPPSMPGREGAPPFNMRVAASKLAAVTDHVQDCKQGDAAGDGRVKVVFDPSGDAQSAVVHGPPFEGTLTGACVEERVRAVQVPPFSGAPFTVDKNFVIHP
jgi:hypothetical protein